MIDYKVEEKQGEVSEEKEKIVEILSRISFKLKKIKDRNKKKHMIVELNDNLKEKGEIIEKVCSEKLISILNSL